MLGHIAVPLTNGKLRATYRFYWAEAWLYRQGGPTAYVTLAAESMSRKLDAAGAVGPYAFWIDAKAGDGQVVPFAMIGEEQ